MKRSIRHTKGFTLIELMTVVAIIAILAVIAYPSYEKSVKKTRRKDAEGALMGLAQAMERYYTANNTYVGADTSQVPKYYASESPIDGSSKFYKLRITSASASDYTLQAIPENGQVGDGTIQLKSTGERAWDSNNDGSFSTAEKTWDQ